MIKQITDLSSTASVNDLNNCYFVIDNSNKKTQKASFSTLESKISSDIKENFGNVYGPSSSINNHVAVFDGSTGKIIKDSGYTIGEFVTTGSLNTIIQNLLSLIDTLSAQLTAISDKNIIITEN